MRILHGIGDFIFYLITGTLFSWALTCGVMAATVLVPNEGDLLIVCAGFMVFFYLWFFNKYTVAGVSLLLGLGGLVLYLYLRSKAFQVDWYRSTWAWGTELWEFVLGRAPKQEAYTAPVSLAVAGVLSFYTAAHTKLYFNFYLLAVAGLGVFALPVLSGYKTSTEALVLFLFVLLVLFIKRLNLYATIKVKGKRKRTNPVFAICLLPLCLWMLIAAAVLPKPAYTTYQGGSPIKAYQQEKARETVAQAGNFGTDRVLSFSHNGAELGGPITPDDRLVMEVEARQGERGYLAGSVRDTYVDNSWRKSSEVRTALPLQETGWYDITPYSEEIRQNHSVFLQYFGWQDLNYTVYPVEEMSVLFLPGFRTQLRVPEGQALFQDGYSLLSVDDPLRTPESYTVYQLDWRFESEEFAQLLRQMSTGEAAEPESPYLQLPDGLPDRVGELAAELTAGLDNDYDRVGAMAEYLKAMPYTLEPPDTPAGEDFVDHFLFEGREGYCVYFASALAVMARTQGIPTRYVEGFVLPREPGENGRFQVTNANAHAWVEVWLPGLGWMTAEATPPAYRTHTPRPADPLEEEAYQPEQEEQPEELEQPDQGPEEDELPEPELDIPLDLSDPDQEETGEAAAEPPIRPIHPALKVTLVLLLAAVLVALAVRGSVLLYHARLRKLEQLPPRQAARAWYQRFLGASEALGCPMEDNETATAYARRVGSLEPLEGMRPELEAITDIYTRAYYSPHQPTPEELDRLRQGHQRLVERLRARMFRPRYLVQRYLFHRF